MKNLENYIVDFTPQIKNGKIVKMKLSEMSPLEVGIERKLLERNLPRREDRG